MSDNQVIYNVLMDIKGDVGAVKAIAENTRQVLKQHVEDDKVLTDRVRRVELAQAKARGAAKVWTLVGGTLGASLASGVTFLIEYFRH